MLLKTRPTEVNSSFRNHSSSAWAGMSTVTRPDSALFAIFNVIEFPNEDVSLEISLLLEPEINEYIMHYGSILS